VKADYLTAVLFDILNVLNIANLIVTHLNVTIHGNN